MPEELPCAAACEHNKGPILYLLRGAFSACENVLEIGAGTGQHAVYFAEHLPHLHWIACEVPERTALLERRLAAAALPNLEGPLALDVGAGDWPLRRVDGVFAANVAHIMPWPAVTAMFAGIGQVLAPAGVFCLYGPFNAAGGYTSDSNALFDAELRSRDPAMGLRDIEALQELAGDAGLRLQAEHAMPANNRMLVWHKDSVS